MNCLHSHPSVDIQLQQSFQEEFSRFLETQKKESAAKRVFEEFGTSLHYRHLRFLMTPSFIEQVASRIPDHAVTSPYSRIYSFPAMSKPTLSLVPAQNKSST